MVTLCRPLLSRIGASDIVGSSLIQQCNSTASALALPGPTHLLAVNCCFILIISLSVGGSVLPLLLARLLAQSLFYTSGRVTYFELFERSGGQSSREYVIASHHAGHHSWYSLVGPICEDSNSTSLNAQPRHLSISSGVRVRLSKNGSIVTATHRHFSLLESSGPPSLLPYFCDGNA